jgi:hypothetical protein
MYNSSEDAIRAAAPAQALLLVAKADTDQSPPLARLRVYVATNDAPATLKITPLQKPNGSAAVDADAVTLTFGAGVTWEDIGARKVWATGSTPNAVVHGVPLV